MSISFTLPVTLSNWLIDTLTAVGADKSLAGPERKQAAATEYFDFHMSYL